MVSILRRACLATTKLWYPSYVVLVSLQQSYGIHPTWCLSRYNKVMVSILRHACLATTKLWYPSYVVLVSLQQSYGIHPTWCLSRYNKVIGIHPTWCLSRYNKVMVSILRGACLATTKLWYPSYAYLSRYNKVMVSILRGACLATTKLWYPSYVVLVSLQQSYGIHPTSCLSCYNKVDLVNRFRSTVDTGLFLVYVAVMVTVGAFRLSIDIK